jgi:hypothetical protein
MTERSVAQDFLDAYRAALEAVDVSAIAGLFSTPFQITSDAGAVSVTTVPTAEAWVPQLETPRLQKALVELQRRS